MSPQHKNITANTNDWDHEWSGTGWYLQVWKTNGVGKKPCKKGKLLEENLFHFAVSYLTKIFV